MGKYDTTYEKDKNHPDTEIISFAGQNMKLGDVRSLYDRFNEHYYKMVLFWDDVVQYTSLGLIDVLFEEYGIVDDIPLAAFFEREQTHGIDFVHEYMNKNYKISKEEINEIYKNNYEKILKISPLSSNAVGLFKTRDILDGVHIVFNNEFNYSQIIKGIEERYKPDHYIVTDIGFSHGSSTENYINNLIKSKRQFIDVVATQDAGFFIDYAMKHDIYELTILAPIEHNGIAPGAQLAYIEMEFKAPNMCELIFLKEELSC